MVLKQHLNLCKSNYVYIYTMCLPNERPNPTIFYWMWIWWMFEMQKCNSKVHRFMWTHIRMCCWSIIRSATTCQTLHSTLNRHAKHTDTDRERQKVQMTKYFNVFAIFYLPLIINTTIQFAIASETWVHQTFWTRTTL